MEPLPRPAGSRAALILYDEFPKFDAGSLYSVLLANLLGHFQLGHEIKPVSEYHAGDMDGFEAIFYLGFIKNAFIPPAFFSDVYKTQKPVVWFRNNLNQLQGSADFDFLKEYGFCYIKTALQGDPKGKERPPFYDRFYYKGQVLDRREITGRLPWLGDLSMTVARITDPSIVKVWATAEKPETAEKIPYILQAKNLWFVADIPFDFLELRDRYLILCDILHEMLKIDHPRKLTALLRVEDVSPATDPEELKKFLKFFKKQKVPLSMGVIPFFKDPTGTVFERPVDLSFSDAAETLQVIKDFQKGGGAVLMHGITHQCDDVKDPKLRITAVGYEFWDYENNRPLKNDTAAFVRGRLAAGKNEFIKQGLSFDAFEVPHYTASPLDHRIFAREFDFAMHEVVTRLYDTTRIPMTPEREKTASDFEIQQPFPYKIYKSVCGECLIPSGTIENFEDADAKTAETVEKKKNMILKQAEALTVVRDGCASFYVHPFIFDMMKQHRIKAAAVWKEVLTGMKRMGYEFCNIKTYEEQQ